MDFDIEKLQYLLQFRDEYFTILIYRILENDADASRYPASVIYNMIICYLEIENKVGVNDKYGMHIPFCNAKTFIYALCSKYEYFKFMLKMLIETKGQKDVNVKFSDIEKLNYAFRFMEEYICISINEVLNDSKTDPDYSAVAVTNIIKCYIEIKNQIGDELPFYDVKSFFEIKGFSDNDYNEFEESRKSESAYYRDIQY